MPELISNWLVEFVDEMKQQVTNFGRFYAALRELSIIGDRDEVKESLVWQYTGGRTESLREMTRVEYERCCLGLERRSGRREQLRKERSATLKLMQRIGIDTTDWARVNAFCLDRRIAGKEFARIGAEEHPDLRRKLRSIEGKGGLGKHPAPAKRRVVIIPTHPGGEA